MLLNIVIPTAINNSNGNEAVNAITLMWQY